MQENLEPFNEFGSEPEVPTNQSKPTRSKKALYFGAVVVFLVIFIAADYLLRKVGDQENNQQVAATRTDKPQARPVQQAPRMATPPPPVSQPVTPAPTPTAATPQPNQVASAQQAVELQEQAEAIVAKATAQMQAEADRLTKSVAAAAPIKAATAVLKPTSTPRRIVTETPSRPKAIVIIAQGPPASGEFAEQLKLFRQTYPKK